MFSSAGCPLLKAEGFFCGLDVLYGGLGISIAIFDKKNIKCCVNFFQFLVIRAPDPDRYSA